MEPLHALNSIIKYRVEYQLFYCHLCRSTYVFVQLNDHLKRKHAIASQGRQDLLQCFERLPLPPAVRDRKALYRQPPQVNLSCPVAFLPTLDGFACNHCHGQDSYYSLNRKAVQEHLNQAHQLFRQASIIGLRPAKLQSWYSSTRAQYWEVARPTSPEVGTPSAPLATATTTAGATLPRQSYPTKMDLTILSQLEAIEEDEDNRLVELAANHQAAQDEGEADQTTPWLVATEWPKQFAQRPLDVISAYAKHPAAVPVAAGCYTIGSFQGIELTSSKQDEERLLQISQLFTHVFDQGIQTLQDAPYQIRCWLKSYSPHEFFSRPFSQLQKPGTRHRYQRQWQCFLCFCFRAWRLDPELRQRLFGPSLDLAPYHATIQQIWDLLDQAEDVPLPLLQQNHALACSDSKPWDIAPGAIRG
jgi:hypothetical protein